MSEKRLQQLLQSYGADPQQWPEADRHLARLLDADAPAGLLEEARQVDQLLLQMQREDLPQVDTQPMVERIMRQTASADSPPWLDALFDWLFPKASVASLLRPALAASMALVVGILMGLVTPAELVAPAELAASVTLAEMEAPITLEDELRFIAITEYDVEEW